jgi:hypothetical protein
MNGGFSYVDRLTRPSTILIQARLYARSFRDKSFPKDEKVISKKKMVNYKAIPSNLEAFDKTIPFLFEHKSREDFSTQNKEKWRNEISLSQPSLRGEKTKRASI